MGVRFSPTLLCFVRLTAGLRAQVSRFQSVASKSACISYLAPSLPASASQTFYRDFLDFLQMIDSARLAFRENLHLIEFWDLTVKCLKNQALWNAYRRCLILLGFALFV